MNGLTAFLDRPRLIFAAILIISLGALANAYVAQYVYGFEPCRLCLYQRVPYAVTALLAIIAFFLASGGGRVAMAALCAGAYLAGAGIAFYHVGVEQHWWLSECTGALARDLSIEEMKAQLMSKPQKPCDDVEWTFLGLSMATYNAAFSLALAAASLAGARLLARAP
ncbi:MAG: disulfide bond formation protein B [Rhodospirillales bacterium]|jgi:disulfide bond formation protein DsbB|nr:disulfide bond formation protein B [Rhodospirillales bacterium]MDP7214742.1 disulfide bond formation protein B [Rhodospirillales bacterium]HIJ42842.1 disulfide bond formation protein B [Rhodospirillaceae bacterium]HIJ92782.1 disulfide bond formation protein B [Rhodospirillaceae bacterium]HJP53804.1 disulfide bond formation protein B [Rhodospirillales bacterium]